MNSLESLRITGKIKERQNKQEYIETPRKALEIMLSNLDEKRLHQRIKALSDAFLLSSKALNYKSVLRMVTRHFKIFTDADASVLLLSNNNGDLTPCLFYRDSFLQN